MNDRLVVEDLDRLGIDTVIIAGTDIQGRMFGKRMSPRVFATKVDEGLHICTCVYAWDMAQSLDGLHVDFAGAHTGWHDFALVPDLPTLRRAAWLEDTAICLADCVDEHDGAHLAVAPRTILRRQVATLAERQLRACTAEVSGRPRWRGGATWWTPWGPAAVLAPFNAPAPAPCSSIPLWATIYLAHRNGLKTWETRVT